jgi:molecular chaperone DnaJ
MKNYYDILGVAETATQDEIKKSYRKLSKQYHPDVNPEGEEKFKDIAEAYDILGDENKRQQYNQRKNNPFMGNMGGGFDVHSMFEEMINGNRRQTAKVPDKIINLEVTPIESYFGVQKNIHYDYLVVCNPCNGNGGERSVCNFCNGQGFVTQRVGTGMFQQIFNMTCDYCKGQGSIITKKCNTCQGGGMVKEKESLLVNIPKNVDNGDFLRLGTRGDFGRNTNNRGDLILKIELIKHDSFEKLGRDLIYNLKLNILEILAEKQITLPHPDGKLMINMPKNLNSDKPLRLVKKGYKDVNGSGDFYVKVSVTNEYELSEDKKRDIKEILKEVI